MIPVERFVKRSIDMDSNDFRAIIQDAIREEMSKLKKAEPSNYVTGYDGLSVALGGVCISTLKKWKDEGRLEGAYKQIERTIIFDVNKIYSIL